MLLEYIVATKVKNTAVSITQSEGCGKKHARAFTTTTGGLSSEIFSIEEGYWFFTYIYVCLYVSNIFHCFEVAFAFNFCTFQFEPDMFFFYFAGGL